MKFSDKLIKIFLSLSFLLYMAPTVTGVCQLQSHYLEDEWRLIVYYYNGNLQLLRDVSVPNGAILYLVCTSNDVLEVTCDNDQFSIPQPWQGCANRMMPQLKPENDESLCQYNLYRVGYEINCRNNSYFFETYKVCFDFARKRTLFAINEAHPFVKSRPFGMQFDPDEIFTMNIFSAYNKRDIYAQFNKILGINQRYMPPNAGDERLDRGHLTPAGDYMTNTLIASTFKMINIIPQFHTINDGNWKRMEEWARNPINTPAKVCSGAFNWVLQLPDTNGILREMYLRNSIPIPLWTYKIVLNAHGVRTVFLQYNNIHDTQVPPPIPNQICKEVSCPPNIILIKSNNQGYTYCCEPEHFMANTVPNLRGHC